ncbi:MAG: methyltransferase domain-containing protein [Novosphingobium sp.]|nr:methyltransferase domain-containing protein [Novosphingobium sp.]
MTDKREWEGPVGRSWAEEWRRTDRSFAELTPRLLEAIAALPGGDVVDIGCGAGQLSLAVADARPDARMLGIDVSADLVAAATIRAQGRRNCAFALADAATWEPDRGAPDLYISRHGVMFFDDPVAAFVHLAGVAQRGANLCFSCFRSPRENPWASGIAALLPAGGAPPDPHAPGPFAFADPRRVAEILESSGWRDVAFAPHDIRYIAGQGPDPVAEALALFARIGPAARAMRELPEDERPAFQARLAEFVAEHRRGDTVAFGAGVWIATAVKA